jgi:hypothetical protein
VFEFLKETTVTYDPVWLALLQGSYHGPIVLTTGSPEKVGVWEIRLTTEGVSHNPSLRVTRYIDDVLEEVTLPLMVVTDNLLPEGLSELELEVWGALQIFFQNELDVFRGLSVKSMGADSVPASLLTGASLMPEENLGIRYQLPVDNGALVFDRVVADRTVCLTLVEVPAKHPLAQNGCWVTVEFREGKPKRYRPRTPENDLALYLVEVLSNT